MSSAAKAPADTGTAVAERPSDEIPAPPSSQDQVPVTILDIVNRAAFDPSVDADKVKTLLEVARVFEQDKAKRAYTRDMLKVKLELPIIDRKGCIEIHEKNKPKTPENLVQSTPFARWEDIDAAITPILNKHGFVLTFRTGNADDGRITVTGILSHVDGHSDESTMALPLDTSGSKNNVQAAGSSTSYGKRYTATTLLNIRTKGEDDDGTAGGATSADDPITPDQLTELTGMLAQCNGDAELFCQYMKVPAMVNIRQGDIGKAREALNNAISEYQRKNPKPKAGAQ